MPEITAFHEERSELMDKATENGWVECERQMPPDHALVMTKIDDGAGVRNEQALSFHNNLWWTGEGGDAMYVYYSPTHWKRLEPNPLYVKGGRIEKETK